jgi:hypothetical protein
MLQEDVSPLRCSANPSSIASAGAIWSSVGLTITQCHHDQYHLDDASNNFNDVIFYDDV